MLALLIGDTHGDIDAINRSVTMLSEQHGLLVDAAFQLGDFGFDPGWTDEETGREVTSQWMEYVAGREQFLVPTYAVHGNHEKPDIADWAMSCVFGEAAANFKCFANPSFSIIQSGRPRGGSLSVLAVGGAPNYNDPEWLYPFDDDDYLRALQFWRGLGSPPVDLLLTHEAPFGVGLMGEGWVAEKTGTSIFNTGSKKLSHLWREVQPRLQINGHYHKLNEFRDGPLRHMTLPVAQAGFAVLDTDTWSLTTVSTER